MNLEISLPSQLYQMLIVTALIYGKHRLTSPYWKYFMLKSAYVSLDDPLAKGIHMSRHVF